ncbi:hypothetical protein [Caulobacter segnis]|uniref:hypothetical protein n=1 Tax=Caulobacter segnis TaxID=88688 RepID=UPI00285D168A|nr:hypothetical protein [Caulobacter segnis]MDR6625698.1 hypothetical protein [Caulobacter segnis]
MVTRQYDVPPTLSADAAFMVAEVLEEYAPSSAEDLERLAREAYAGASAFDGGPSLAREVAEELRRRARALRDAGR